VFRVRCEATSVVSNCACSFKAYFTTRSFFGPYFPFRYLHAITTVPRSWLELDSQTLSLDLSALPIVTAPLIIRLVIDDVTRRGDAF